MKLPRALEAGGPGPIESREAGRAVRTAAGDPEKRRPTPRPAPTGVVGDGVDDNEGRLGLVIDNGDIPV